MDDIEPDWEHEQHNDGKFTLIFWGVIFTLLACAAFGCQIVPASHTIPVIPAVSSTAGQIVAQAGDLPWIITVSLFGITGGILAALFAPGPFKTIGMIASLGCAILLGLTLLVVVYAKWLVLGVAVLAVSLGVYAVVVQKKAVPELVKTVEAVKAHLTAEAKELLFGGKVSGTVTQSPTTEILVKEIRNA